MNGIDVLWSTRGTQALAWALMQFLWQGTVVALALAAALSLLRDRSSSLRYALVSGALLAMFVWPALTVLGSLERGAPEATVAAAPPSIEIATGAAAIPVQAAPAGPSAPASLRALIEPWLPGLLAFWVAGVVVLSIYHLGGWLEARRLTRRGTRPAAEHWVAMLADLRQRLGIAREVRLLESKAVSVPCVIGWLLPVILVPASTLSGLTPEQVEAVLAHELAHVRRHDYLFNLLQAVVETLFFYHPAVWWVSRQMRLEREYCCDDMALKVCGDRLRYARALATLEELRLPSSRLVMAANGGSLLLRIRRIVGVPARTRPNALLAVVAVLAFFSGAAVLSARGASTPTSAAGPQAAAVMAQARLAEDRDPERPAPQMPQSTKATGRWTAERTKEGVHLQLTVSSGEDTMNNSLLLRASDFVGLDAGPGSPFELQRAAGTFRFEGRFEGQAVGSQGAGLFTFIPNPGFAPEMGSLGYRIDNDEILELAIFDVSPDFVRELRGLGYDDLPLKKLSEFRIFSVTPDFIRELAELGYRDLPAERLVEFRIHGVSPRFIRDMAELGYRDLRPERLVEFRIHGVSPEFVRDMTELGYRDLSAERLVEFRIHGVSTAFLDELAGAGYRNVDANDLVAMRIHGVGASFIHEMERQGYKNLSVDELLDLRILGPGRGKGKGGH